MTVSAAIGPFEPNDIPVLDALQPPGWRDITKMFSLYLAAPNCYPIKATVDDRVVGIGTTILHGDTSWLAHVIVHPDFRRQGIATQIVNYLIRLAARFGRNTISLVATDEGRPLYAKAGFRDETKYVFYTGDSVLPPGEIQRTVSPLCEADRPEVLAIDEEISDDLRYLSRRARYRHAGPNDIWLLCFLPAN